MNVKVEPESERMRARGIERNGCLATLEETDSHQWRFLQKPEKSENEFLECLKRDSTENTVI